MIKTLISTAVAALTVIGVASAGTAHADGATPPPWDFYGVLQLGQESVRGTGCGGDGSIGDIIPDGYWRGFVRSIDGPTLQFDLACVYVGDMANQLAAETPGGAWWPDGWPINNKTQTRSVPLAPEFYTNGTRYAADGSVPFNQPGIPFDDNSNAWISIVNGQAQWAVSAPPAMSTNVSPAALTDPRSLPDEEWYTHTPGAIAYNNTDGWSYNFENDPMNPTPLEIAVGNEWLDAPGWPGDYTVVGPDCTSAVDTGYCVFTGFPAHQGGNGFTVFLVWLSPGLQMPIQYIERVDATTFADEQCGC